MQEEPRNDKQKKRDRIAGIFGKQGAAFYGCAAISLATMELIVFAFDMDPKTALPVAAVLSFIIAWIVT